jgi:hypothetical protein
VQQSWFFSFFINVFQERKKNVPETEENQRRQSSSLLWVQTKQSLQMRTLAPSGNMDLWQTAMLNCREHPELRSSVGKGLRVAACAHQMLEGVPAWSGSQHHLPTAVLFMSLPRLPVHRPCNLTLSLTCSLRFSPSWAVAHPCNPSYSRGKDQEDVGSSQPRGKVTKTSSQSIFGCSGTYLLSQAMWDAAS